MVQPGDQLPRIGFVGTYVPRQCGIATFTRDLLEAVSPPAAAFSVALDEGEGRREYGPVVRARIREEERRDYRAAAALLDRDADVVSLQHEFGIFGGWWGAQVMELVNQLRAPLVTTFHTVAAEPSAAARVLIREIAEQSARVVVMNRRGRAFLDRAYGVSPSRVSVIPHGIPDLPFVDPDQVKPRFGVDGRTVLLSFGLVSPAKGFEHAIAALAPLAASHPELLYVIAGATHPNELRLHGERYRRSLEDLVARLGLREQVRFVDRYLPQQELHDWLLAADLYLTPYPHQEQISSGTLAYAMGAGCVVVSSAFWHARGLLRGGRGVLVPPADSVAMTAALDRLLADPEQRAAMRRRAYDASRAATWPVVGERYLETFRTAAERYSTVSTASPAIGGARPA